MLTDIFLKKNMIDWQNFPIMDIANFVEQKINVDTVQIKSVKNRFNIIKLKRRIKLSNSWIKQKILEIMGQVDEMFYKLIAELNEREQQDQKKEKAKPIPLDTNK